MCPPGLTPAEPGAALVALGVIFLVGGLVLSRIGLRAIRRRRIDVYRDPRLNPVGVKAVVYGAVILAVAWLGIAMVVWLNVCGFAKR